MVAHLFMYEMPHDTEYLRKKVAELRADRDRIDALQSGLKLGVWDGRFRAYWSCPPMQEGQCVRAEIDRAIARGPKLYR